MSQEDVAGQEVIERPRLRGPRRLIRPLRYVLYLVLAFLIWHAFSSYSILTLPEDEPALFAFRPGQRVIVTALDPDRAPEPGDVVLFGDGAGAIAMGRLVALAGDRVEVDPGGRRLRLVGGAEWYPAPERVVARLPVRRGQALILAENPIAVEAGEVVPVARIVARVIAGLPF